MINVAGREGGGGGGGSNFPPQCCLYGFHKCHIFKSLLQEVESKNRRSRSGSMADVVVAAVADSEVAKDLKSTREELESSKTGLLWCYEICVKLFVLGEGQE